MSTTTATNEQEALQSAYDTTLVSRNCDDRCDDADGRDEQRKRDRLSSVEGQGRKSNQMALLPQMRLSPELVDCLYGCVVVSCFDCSSVPLRWCVCSQLSKHALHWQTAAVKAKRPASFMPPLKVEHNCSNVNQLLLNVVECTSFRRC